MANTIKVKRGTNLSNAGTPAEGELVWNSNTNKLYVGNGSTAATGLTAIGGNIYTAGTNITLNGTEFDVDDAFLKNDANDTTSGTITAAGFTTSGNLTLGGHAVNDIDIGSEFVDADDHLMTSGAIKEKIESYSYLTSLGDAIINSGTWNGAGFGGSRYKGLTINSGELSIQRDHPNSGQVSLLVDGGYSAGENNGFWSLYDGNDWGNRVGFYSNSSGVGIFNTTHSSGDWNFQVNGSSKMYIDGSASRVGINTTSPAEALEVAGCIKATGTNAFTIGNVAGAARIQESSGTFTLLTTGNAYASLEVDDLTANGSVSIGGHAMADIDVGSEFVDTDDHLMTSGAIKEKIESYSYLTSSSGVASLSATDDRDFKPNTIDTSGQVRAYFTTLEGMTGSAGSDYQDMLVLDTYSDGTGGDSNALVFDKSTHNIYHYLADQAASTWGTPKRLAYIENGSNNRVMTASSSSTVNGEANLTFNGTQLTNTGDIKIASGALGVNTNPLSDNGSIVATNDIIAGQGGGSVAMTINDGGGNANLTFNHRNKTPDQNGQSARIEVNVDATSTEGIMYFETSTADVTSGSAVTLANAMTLTHDYMDIPNKIRHMGDTDTYMQFSAADTWKVYCGGDNPLTAIANRVYVNASGANGLLINNDEGDSSNSARIFFEGTETGAIFQSGTALSFRSGATTGSSSGTQQMYINSSGLTVTNNLTVTGASTFNYGAVFNEGGNNSDFRVEGDSNANLVRVDASEDRVGIGTGSPSARFHVYSEAESVMWFQNGSTSNVQSIEMDSSRFYFYNRTAGAFNSISVLNDGKVGIGQITPGYKLDVTGDARFTADIKSEGRIMAQNGTAAAPAYSFTSQGDAGMTRVGNGVGFSADDYSRVEIDAEKMFFRYNSTSNSTTGACRIQFPNDQRIFDNGSGGLKLGAASHAVEIYSGSSTDRITFITGGISGTERMRITPGKIGIMTTTPYEALEVESQSSTSPAIVAANQASNGCFNMAHGYSGANGDYINTYSTQYSSIATVIGYGVKASTDTNDQFLCSADNSNFTRGALVIDDELRFWQAGAQNGTLNNAITMTERFRLTAAGIGHFDSDVVAYSSTVSDKRLKENITTIDNALDKVMALRGVEYDWTATSRKGTHDIGLVAQEVEEVIPELVTEHELCTGEFGGEGNEKTFKTVNYDKIVGVLIEAIKEQQVQIDELKTKLGD